MLRASDLDLVDSSPMQNCSDWNIEGLRFVANQCWPVDDGPGWFTLKTGSSIGPLVSDFVTHEEGFSYSTYGIHVGQDDRLTFFGPADQVITGHFVDCRIDSATSGNSCNFTFRPDPACHLVIPRGVAHTFDGLERIVTRDEPVWHADTDNDAWNIDNDLVSVPRETPIDEFPRVRANRHLLPESAHQFMSRLSQELLENPKSYLARYQVNVGGEDQYIMLEPTGWEVNPKELRDALGRLVPDGLSLRAARYAATGPESWTLVPSTESCVADVLHFPGTDGRCTGPFRYHLRTRKYYTFFAEGAELGLEVLDLRKGAGWESLGMVSMHVDPRIVLVVEPGVAYRISMTRPTTVRCEHEVFTASDEPRADLPAFGADLLHLEPGNALPQVAAADIPCPPAIIRLLARAEQDGA